MNSTFRVVLWRIVFSQKIFWFYFDVLYKNCNFLTVLNMFKKMFCILCSLAGEYCQDAGHDDVAVQLEEVIMIN